MKRFLLVALLLVSAASAYAADLKITGDAEVRGVMVQADQGDQVLSNSYFDADFNFNAALVVTENTTVFTKLTFDSQKDFDANGGTSVVPDQEAADINAVAAGRHTFLGVERAYISTKFLPALTVDAGLMGGGMWGTAFSNNESNITRIKATYAIDENMSVMAIYEKNWESLGGTPAALGGTADPFSDVGDTTTYYLQANLNFGAIKVLPLFKYQIAETNAAEDTTDNTWAADIAVMGDMGMLGFEAEVVYISTDAEVAANDATKYGVYVDVFAKLDPAKVGLAAFYAGATEDGVFDPGADLDYLIVAGEYAAMDISGTIAFKLYADAKVMEKVSCGAAFAYGMATDKDYTTGGDVAFWEVDVDVNYLIDAATTWTLEGGYASYDDGSADALTAYTVQQKISVKF